MREFNALREYPLPREVRYVGPDIRTIRNRIIASYRDKRYYDGERNNGYGGFKYDGRWRKIMKSMANDYQLTEKSSLLQIGCEKGFLLHEFFENFQGMKIRGCELSEYAIEHAMPSIKGLIKKANYCDLPFNDNEFDFVIAIGAVYTLNLRDVITAIREIQRVGNGKSFITLGAYRDEEGKKLFNWWTLLGATILHVDEWIEVLKEAGYTGDYHFTTAETLKLVIKK